MTLNLVRALFILLSAAVAWSFIKNPDAYGPNSWLSLGVGVILATLLVCADILFRRKKLSVLSGTFFGLIVGISLAYALSFITPLIIDQYEFFYSTTIAERTREAVTRYINLMVGVTTCYLAISLILQTKDDFRFIIPYVEFSKQTKGARPILLDTSVLIDGRIGDVTRSGIIESQLIVPRFVILELQNIADSANKLLRNRGRRGLDTVAELKSNPKIELVDYDSSASGRIDKRLPVDEQLLLVARDLNARVLTNDLNLNKVAGLRGVDVINLNDLANAMKPLVIPGERMVVRIIKPGEGVGQGVGYLDDGTMVVVEQGRPFIDEDVEFTVTNTRQTTAGKMIFGRIDTAASASTSDASSPPSRRVKPRPETTT